MQMLLQKDCLEIEPDQFFLKKRALMRIAAAGDISIDQTENIPPAICKRCAAANALTGKIVPCFKCPNKAVAFTATVSKTDPFTREKRSYVGSCEITHEAVEQMIPRAKKFRNEICESRAILRALRMAMELQETYSSQELQQPLLIKRVIPNLDNPEVREIILGNLRNSNTAAAGIYGENGKKTVEKGGDENDF